VFSYILGVRFAFLPILCYNLSNQWGLVVMKERKHINKLIISNVIEIIFVMAFIAITIPLWLSLHSSESLASASIYDDFTYTSLYVEDSKTLTMYPISDDVAIKYVNPYKITLVNDSLTLENYDLVLKIDKSSTMDYKGLKISINGNISYLKDLNLTEDDDNYIILLDNDDIVGETRDYSVKLWLDENSSSEIQGKNLVMSFDLIKNTTEKM
jgi:hypothetical protein